MRRKIARERNAEFESFCSPDVPGTGIYFCPKIRYTVIIKQMATPSESERNTGMTVGIYTLGCKVNQYESQALSEALERAGYTIGAPSGQCDAYIINTCTVTAEADRKVRQFVRRAISSNPDARILVCGCSSQRDPNAIAKIPGVDYISGNASKMSLVDTLTSLLSRPKAGSPDVCVTDIMKAPFEDISVSSFERTRAYIKIEDGCESPCAYCVIPSVRGKIRSKSKDAVLQEAASLAEKGFREIVLTGIEICSWGKDLGDETLCDLLEELDRIPGIERIRLGSMDPHFFSPAHIERLAALTHLAPHIHLAVQSCCDSTLARMRRKYNTAMLAQRMRSLRAAIPDLMFTTDIMTGFPGETEEEFAQTKVFFAAAGFLYAHIFTYSRRPGTEADRMPDQVPENVKIRRSAELEAIRKQTVAELLDACVGRTFPVLFETQENGSAFGRAPNYLGISVPIPEGAALHGRIRNVRVLASDGVQLSGELTD